MVPRVGWLVVAFDLRRWTKNETTPELERTREGSIRRVEWKNDVGNV